MYEHYKKARDMSWKVLLECGINSLPVDLWKIAEHFDPAYAHLFQIQRYPTVSRRCFTW